MIYLDIWEMALPKRLVTSTKKINSHLKGQDPTDQEKIDTMLLQLDGTPNKSNLGGNALLGVSLAVARAASHLKNQSLFSYLSDGDEYIMPVPLMNILNGGSHADNAIDFQEFMIMPIGAKTLPERPYKCRVKFFERSKII